MNSFIFVKLFIFYVKSQGLPITTIIIIILAILALVVVVLFLFGGFEGVREPTGGLIDIGREGLDEAEEELEFYSKIEYFYENLQNVVDSNIFNLKVIF